MNFRRAALKGGPTQGGPASYTLGRMHNRASRRAALKGGPAGCTTERAGGLHQKAGRRAAQQGGLRNRAGWKAAHQGGLHNRAGRRAAHKYVPAGCTTGWAGGLPIILAGGRQRNGGLHINTCRRAAEKGRPFDTRRTALKIITLASFRRSSRCAKWRTVRCKGGLR